MKQYIDDLISLFLPCQCRVCGETLTGGEKILCSACQFDLPRTNYHNCLNNPVAELFWGRVPFVAATAYYYFEKGSKYQELLHKMKYLGQREIGYELGTLFGMDIRFSEGFSSVNLVMPVPLHPRKERKRGFNQSEWVARGIAHGMQKPVVLKNLVRNRYSSSQTKKSRMERWENVEKIFGIRDAEMLVGMHILLVDDVVTTGATLEACAREILSVPGTRLSMAALAVA